MAQQKERIAAFLNRLIETEAVPGVVCGIADSSETLLQASAGVQNSQTQQRMTNESIVAIASMTKPITTMAVLQLFEQGLVGLDEPVSDYLPELAGLKFRTGFDDQGRQQLKAVDPLPTLRQLLTHTSGFVYEIWNENASIAVTSGQTESAFSPGGLDVPLGFEPGERWEYGIGIDWAGRVVEKISGKPLDVYFADHIFLPLGMKDTAFSVPEPKQYRHADIHRRGPDGFLVEPGLAVSVSGGGGLQSTVSDYIQFMRCILNQGNYNGSRLLQPETVKLMMTNQIGDLTVGPVQSQMSAFSCDFDLTFSRMGKWSLGFLLHQQKLAAGRSTGSVSWAGLFNSFFWIDPDSDLCAVIATQLLPFCDPAAMTMLTEFESLVYREFKH
ncbi:MAG: beta-lactamase family protein [Gammaproteobacteria bacterium]|nr:beta-lactamase family protein [Gammaproteobacteria bacterium]